MLVPSDGMTRYLQHFNFRVVHANGAAMNTICLCALCDFLAKLDMMDNMLIVFLVLTPGGIIWPIPNCGHAATPVRSTH